MKKNMMVTLEKKKTSQCHLIKLDTIRTEYCLIKKSIANNNNDAKFFW